MKIKIGVITFLLCIAATGSYAKSDNYDSLITAGIKQIYNIQFDEAGNTFRSLIADYPGKPAGRFFLAMIDWWKILLNLDDESHDEIFFQKLEDVIFQCDEILDKKPDDVDALFFKGGAIGFRGRLRAIRESWLKAADDGREALPIVQKAAKLDPANQDVQLGFGIYNYYAAVIPEEYPLLKPLMIFFPSGDKQKGITQLKNTAEHGKYANYEAQYFLMTLYYHYENQPYEASKWADSLTDKFPDNPTFERWKGRIASKRGNFVKAFQIFKNVILKGDSGYTGYSFPKVTREAVYYVGYEYREVNKLDSAKYYFQKCAEISKNIDGDEASGFLINSFLYLGMINDEQGNRDEAIKYYRQLLDMRNYGQSQQLAKQYIANAYKRN